MDGIDLSGITRAINNLNSNLKVVDQHVNYVSGQVENVRREVRENIAAIRAELVEMERQQMLTAAFQRATTEVIRVRQELEQKFGAQKQVREYMLGILGASDLGLIKKTTISNCTEELMISAPKYWLAPCLIALAAWISDNKSLANRAVKEALRRDEQKTCLLFALITRRVNAGRVASGQKATNTTFLWLSRYFSLQNPFKMRTSIISYIDAYSNGIFGYDKDHICEEHINNWMKQLERANPKFKEDQTAFWLDKFKGYVLDFSIEDRKYSSLKQICLQYQEIVDYVSKINASEREEGIRSEFSEMINAIVDKEKLINDIDFQLRQLVTNYEEDEEDLRNEEQYLEYVKKFKGDEDKAKRIIERFKELSKDDPVDFASRISHSVFDSGVSISAKKTALSLMKPYIKEAYTEFINANKETYPSEVDFVIENSGTSKVKKYRWAGKSSDGSNKSELIASYKTQLEADKKKEIDAISDEKLLKKRKTGIILMCTVVFFIIPVGPLMYRNANRGLRQNQNMRNAIEAEYNNEINKNSEIIGEAVDAKVNADEIVAAFDKKKAENNNNIEIMED